MRERQGFGTERDGPWSEKEKDQGHWGKGALSERKDKQEDQEAEGNVRCKGGSHSGSGFIIFLVWIASH